MMIKLVLAVVFSALLMGIAACAAPPQQTPLTKGDTPVADSSTSASPDDKAAASKQEASRALTDTYQKDLAQCRYEAAASTPTGSSRSTWGIVNDVFAEEVRKNQLINLCLQAKGYSLR